MQIAHEPWYVGDLPEDGRKVTQVVATNPLTILDQAYNKHTRILTELVHDLYNRGAILRALCP